MALSSYDLLDGEQLDLHMCSPIEAPDSMAVMYRHSDSEKDCEMLPCTFFVSQYRMAFRVAQQQASSSSTCVSIPLMAIEMWSITPASSAVTQCFAALQSQARRRAAAPTTTTTTTPSLLVMTLQTKHVWRHQLVIPNDRRIVKTLQALLAHSARTQALDKLPAFAFQRARLHSVDAAAGEGDCSATRSIDFGWNIYDCAKEFQRQLCVDPSTPRPVITAADDLDQVGIGKDLRPWFREVDLQTSPAAVVASYTCCPTYPRRVMLPAELSRQFVFAAMAARSRARIPIISYVHLRSGAVLARCAQPLMRSEHLTEDSHLCYTLVNSRYDRNNLEPGSKNDAKEKAAASGCGCGGGGARPHAPPPSLFDDDDAPSSASLSPSSKTPTVETNIGGGGGTTLLVADCRPFIAATGNAQLGGGYESGPFYTFCKTSFYDIDNIFGISKAMGKLRGLVSNWQGNRPEDGFWKALHDSRWLYHLQRVLVCSVEVAQALDRGDSCLVHCTDGWDRTSQCCALAMMLLDPYYRTTVGFCVLLEKEFCSMGHRMAERNGHQVRGRTSVVTHSGVSSSDTESKGGKPHASPIFMQHMDAVFQVMRQFPNQFEFTPRLLEYLGEAVYACYHGTFLCNCEQERTLEGVRLFTPSVWTDVLRQVELEKQGKVPLCFINEHYEAATAWASIKAKDGPMLVPNCNSKRIVFWEAYYQQWDLDRMCHAHHRPVSRQLVVSWGEEFDAFLKAEVSDACRARDAEMPLLEALEKRVHASAATAVAARQSPQTFQSEWCVFDNSICFACFRPVGLFYSTCERCGYCFCRDCTRHDCLV